MIHQHILVNPFLHVSVAVNHWIRRPVCPCAPRFALRSSPRPYHSLSCPWWYSWRRCDFTRRDLSISSAETFFVEIAVARRRCDRHRPQTWLPVLILISIRHIRAVPRARTARAGRPGGLNCNIFLCIRVWSMLREIEPLYRALSALGAQNHKRGLWLPATCPAPS